MLYSNNDEPSNLGISLPTIESCAKMGTIAISSTCFPSRLGPKHHKNSALFPKLLLVLCGNNTIAYEAVNKRARLLVYVYAN